MQAYYAKSEASVKKFIYIQLQQPAEIEKFQAPQRKAYHEAHDHGTEVHLTTDGAFERYCNKRLAVPALVVIFNTQNELNNAIEEAGYFI